MEGKMTTSNNSKNSNNDKKVKPSVKDVLFQKIGNTWFIFSEVMFFGAFFSALWWARAHSVPELGNVEHRGD
jgi:heme/copper-type cytochrome/quinol oxidase subunit 3